MLTLLFALAAAAATSDQAFVKAAAAGDVKTAAAMLDQDFTWTNADGKTLDAAHVRQALPKPAVVNEAAAQTATYDYGAVDVVQVNSGKLHTLRVWVKRPGGWRLLVYQEVKSLDAPAPAGGAPTAGTKRGETSGGRGVHPPTEEETRGE